MAERICYLSHEQVGAILGARRVADGNSNEEENLRIGLKLLRESAQLQMDVAETALQKLDEATKPRLVPS